MKSKVRLQIKTQIELYISIDINRPDIYHICQLPIYRKIKSNTLFSIMFKKLMNKHSGNTFLFKSYCIKTSLANTAQQHLINLYLKQRSYWRIKNCSSSIFLLSKGYFRISFEAITTDLAKYGLEVERSIIPYTGDLVTD